MFEFNNYDTYNVNRNTENFKIDTKVLLRLYQPLIGGVALSLYLTLDSEFKLNTISRTRVEISRLLKLLHININDFNEAIEKLKEYKLLTYRANRRQENDYLFKISLPLTAKEFFSNLTFKNKLKKIVDEIYFKQVHNYFLTNQIDEDDYVDISELNFKIKTDDDFFDLLEDKYDTLNGIFDMNSRKEIIRVKKLFNLEYSDVELAIFQAIDYNPNPYVNLEKYNDYIETNLKYKNKQKNSSSLDPNFERFLDDLEKQNPLVYYQTIFKRTLLPIEEQSLKNIQYKYHISDGLLNATIWYYKQYGNKTIRSYNSNYIEKVIVSLIDNNCVTANDAINYFKSIRTQSNYLKDNNQVKVDEKQPIEKQYKEEKKEVDSSLLQEFLKTLGE